MRYFIILIVCLVGCTAPDLPTHYNVKLSSDFTQEELAQLEDGISTWELYTDGPRFTFMVLPNDQLANEQYVNWDDIVIRRDTEADIHLRANSNNIAAFTITYGELTDISEDQGWSSDDLGATVYFPGLDEVSSNYQKMAAHEAGHAMGLLHTGAGTVMCAKTSCATPAPTCADLQYYCSLRHKSCQCQFPIQSSN